MSHCKIRVHWSVLIAIALSTFCARSANEAEMWLQRASQATQKVPSRCDYAAVNSWVQDGVPIILELDGTATCIGPLHCRTELTGVVYPKSDHSARSPVRILTILDGSYEWKEIDMAMGSKSVIKAPLEQAFPGGPCGIEHVIFEAKSLTVSSVDGQIILEETSSEPLQVRVILDQETSRPLEWRVETEDQLTHLKIRRWAFPEAVDPELFVYVPPEGVPVVVVPSVSIDPDKKLPPPGAAQNGGRRSN